MDKNLKSVTTLKAQQTKAHILNTALNLFRENGYDETTMRDIAAAASVATGGAYYYFRSKDDLAMAFYMQMAEESRQVLPPALAKTRDFKKRLHIIIEQKIGQFQDHRRFISALFRTAVDPSSRLSPFAEETKAIREEAIGWFQIAIEGSNVTIPKEFRASMPRLLWLYQMGTILFWIYDKSPDQRRTKVFVSGTIELMVQCLRLVSLPLLGPVRRRAASIIHELEIAQ